MFDRILSPAVVLTVIVSALPLGDLEGQGMAPGTRLRWKEGTKTVRGTTADSSRVRVDYSSTRPIPWDNPTLEQQVRASRRGRGAGVGLVVGAIAGLMIGFASGDDTCGDGGWCLFSFSAGEKAAMGAIALGPIGALIGAAAAPGAQWAPVGESRSSARVRLHLDHRMLGLRATF